MRVVAAIAIALASAALAGCGGSSSSTQEGGSAPAPGRTSAAPAGAAARTCDAYAVDASALRATGVSCRQARQVMFGWQRDSRCAPPRGASRSACTTRSYRCASVRTQRGLAVSCARAGESIAFLAKRG